MRSTTTVKRHHQTFYSDKIKIFRPQYNKVIEKALNLDVIVLYPYKGFYKIYNTCVSQVFILKNLVDALGEQNIPNKYDCQRDIEISRTCI